MIKLQVIGNIGKDATTNTVGNKQVINFSVAHTEKWKDAQGQQQSKTTWVDCAYWTDKTGLLPYLVKGTQVYVEGTAEARAYESNGSPAASLVLKVQNIQLLGSPNKQEGGQPQQAASQSAPAAGGYDDLPF